MLGRTPSTERPEHHEKQKSAATANDQWKENGDYRPAGIRFVRASKADAVDNDLPN
jgi:hypothetical protein